MFGVPEFDFEGVVVVGVGFGWVVCGLVLVSLLVFDVGC